MSERKPQVTTSCVANRYAGKNKRVIEFSDGPDRGGLISFSRDETGKLLVHVYRTKNVTVCFEEFEVIK